MLHYAILTSPMHVLNVELCCYYASVGRARRHTVLVIVCVCVCVCMCMSLPPVSLQRLKGKC